MDKVGARRDIMIDMKMPAQKDSLTPKRKPGFSNEIPYEVVACIQYPYCICMFADWLYNSTLTSIEPLLDRQS